MTSRAVSVSGFGAVSAFPFHSVSRGVIIAGGGAVVASTSLANVGNDSARGTNWLPPARVPIGTVQPDGTVMIDPQWYRGLVEVFERRLGGVNGQTVTDVGLNATNAIAAVSDLAPTVSLVTQQTNALTSTAAATKAVLVQNDQSGADDIPDPPDPLDYKRGSPLF